MNEYGETPGRRNRVARELHRIRMKLDEEAGRHVEYTGSRKEETTMSELSKSELNRMLGMVQKKIEKTGRTAAKHGTNTRRLEQKIEEPMSRARTAFRQLG